MNQSYVGRVLWGLLIIGTGVAYFLRTMGFIYFDSRELISLFWPVILIVIGIAGLASTRGPGYVWNFLVAIVGVIFLARNLDFISWSIRDIVPFAGPLVLVLFGFGLIFKPSKNKKSRPEQEDWKSFSPNHEERPIPPAPPLHPDPRLQKLDGMTKDDAQARPITSTPTDFNETWKEDREWKKEWKKQQKEQWKDQLKEQRGKYKQWKHGQHNESVEWWNQDKGTQTRSGFIGDLHLGEDYWELKPMNISHFIGDTVIDLTKAQIPRGETKITIASFIGDVKVFLPGDQEIGVQVVSSAFIGDAKILGRSQGGMFRNMDIQSPSYQDKDTRIKFICSTFIGDVKFTKIG